MQIESRAALCLKTGLLGFVLLVHCFPLKAETLEKWDSRVVTIKSYQQEHDWRIPWNKKEIRTRAGMALVIRKPGPQTADNQTRFLLTNADLAANATLIEVTRKDDPHPYRALTRKIDHALNVALLQVEDTEFWKTLNPVEWGKAAKGKLTVLHTQPGTEMKLAEGELERVSVGHRQLRDAWLPILQINLKTPPPQGALVIQEDRAVGMVLNSSQGAVNALPAQLIRLFLEASADNPDAGLPQRGFQWTSLPQQSMSDHFRIPAGNAGIWISRVLPYGTGSGVLKAGDFLTAIGEWKIDQNGKIQHPVWGKTLFDILFLDELRPGNRVAFTVIRDGSELVLSARVSNFRENGRMVPLKRIGVPPRYVIRWGLLFQELTLNYLQVWGNNWQTRAPLRLRLFMQLDRNSPGGSSVSWNGLSAPDVKTDHQRRVVVLSQVLPDEINIGYQDLNNIVVTHVNGRQIQNLESLVSAFEKPSGDFHLLEFLPGSERRQVILPDKLLDSANARILSNFQIPGIQSL